MDHVFIGSVQIQGNFTVSGNSIQENVISVTSQDPILGLGTPTPGAGYDGGLVIQKNPADINNANYSGTIVSATSNTATIQQSGTFNGWMIKITSGTGAGQNAIIISSAGSIVTVSPWTTIPDATSGYSLFAETNVALIYRPSLDEFLIGASYNDHTSPVINITPKPLVCSQIIQTNLEYVYYVGKHGSNSNSGRTIAQALLTFTYAATFAGQIVCFDAGIYSETPTFTSAVFAPNATITSFSSTGNVEIYSVTSFTASNCFIKITNFSSATIAGCTVFFQTGGTISCSSNSFIKGNSLGSISATGNVYGHVDVITGSTAFTANGCVVSVSTGQILSTTLANTNFTGTVNTICSDIANSATAGTGTVYWSDAKRIQNHILNYNNPHQTTINQVSPLTTQGDILAYSTTNIRFPVGPNGYVLSANSSQAAGIQWIAPPSSGFQTFTIAPGQYSATLQPTIIGCFVWNQAQYASLVNGQLIFYVSGTVTVSFIGSITYASATLTGYQALSITLPTSNDVIYFYVSAAAPAQIFDVLLTFGSASGTVSASTAFDTKTISGTYTVLSSDDHLICNTASAPVNLTLPSPFKKTYVIIDNGSAATNNIVITGNINGGSSYTISMNYGGITIFSDTTKWYAY